MSKKPGKIDFAKYRSEELFNSIMELIDVRGIYVGSFFKVMAASLLFAIATGLAFYFKPASMLWWAPIAIYGLFAGGVAGLFFSIAEVIRKSLDNIFKVVELMLEVSKTITRDMRAMGMGETEIPSPKELVRGVYREVVLPLFERAISEKLGFLGAPVLFLYRLTFGRVVRMVINFMPASALAKLDKTDVDTLHKETLSGLKKVADNEDKIIGVLTWTQNKVVNVGGWFRFVVMIPCYIAFGLICLGVLIPVIIAWFIAPEATVDIIPAIEGIPEVEHVIDSIKSTVENGAKK